MKTVFIRAIEADIDDKAAVLREAIRAPETAGTTRFEVDTATFTVVPKSPFAYWTSDALLRCFRERATTAMAAKLGLKTDDDFRYIRTSWEIEISKRYWAPLAKGGAWSPIYSDIHLCLYWLSDGRELKALSTQRWGNPGKRIFNEIYYFRAGLTWPRRTQSGLSIRAMPVGCIFGDKGPAVFVDRDDPDTLLALLAVTNSRSFAALVELQMAFGSYEVGVIQRTPVPELTPKDQAALATLARRSWSLKRSLDTRTENSHAFTLPALLQVDGATLSERADRWLARVSEIEAELASLQAEIDDHCFALYGIDDDERARIEQGFGGGEEEAEADEEEDETEDEEVDIEPMVASLLSWAMGVAFGRFDLRVATGARALPAEPEPFDPLPRCSPGMLTDEQGLARTAEPDGYPLAFPAEGVLVDDLGHPQDLVSRVGEVFEAVFGQEGSERLLEADNHLGNRKEDLRTWFAKRFFPLHIKRYSRSRRKAPIYWQLGTPSGSYSLWCYCHQLKNDSLYRLARDYVAPKVAHEQRKLDALRQEAGAEPSRKQRKAIDQQEAFVSELSALNDEVRRVAPLWKPDLDDGVIIHFAPLWRLVPQNKPWRKECRKVWGKLQQGEYDWAHLAMHLWPERVVSKCAEDRSLAIAHGLEDELWVEDEVGKWRPRRVDSERIDELVAVRSSSAVKAALSALVSAPVPGGTRRRGRRRGGA